MQPSRKQALNEERCSCEAQLYKRLDVGLHMGEKIKISVIIPVYNAEKYLRQCLDSVLSQTLREIEIICVDDASTDGSLAILREYQKTDSRVQVLQNDTSLKAGPSRNKGLRLAKGEYIHFLDADDYLVNDSYEQAYALAHENGADIIRTRAYEVDMQTSETSISPYYSLLKVNKKDFNKALCFLDKPALFLSIPVVPWGGLFQRRFLLEQRIEFSDLMCVNDRSFYAQTMFAASSIILADIYLVYHRINNPDSLVGKRAQYFDCHFENYRLIEEYSRGLPPEVRKMCLDNEMYDICYWMDLYSRGQYKDRIADSTEVFLSGLDTSPWHSIQNTRWYVKISGIIRQTRESRDTQNDREQSKHYHVERFITFIPCKICEGIHYCREYGLRYTWNRLMFRLVAVSSCGFQKNKSRNADLRTAARTQRQSEPKVNQHREQL